MNDKQGSGFVLTFKTMKKNLIGSFLLLIIMIFPANISGQKNLGEADFSDISGIRFPVTGTRDKRILSVAAAKTILEMETSIYQIEVSDIEVLSFPNLSGVKKDAPLSNGEFTALLENEGYEIYPSTNDPSYSWVKGDKATFIMYLSGSKRETAIYLGRIDKMPPFTSPLNQDNTINQGNTQISVPAGKGTVTEPPNPTGQDNNSQQGTGSTGRLYGNWGMISGSPINYIDEGNSMIVSGVSRGLGLELHEDGTYLQVSVIDSGRPNYRINISTVGKWEVKDNLLLFYPTERNYRRWEYELLRTNETSVPEPYSMIWYLSINESSRKECLYVKYDADQQKWEELCRE